MKSIRSIITGLCALSSFAAMQAFASGWHEEPLVYNNGEVVLYFGWYPDPPIKGEYEAFYFYAFADSTVAPPAENWGSGRCINPKETPTDVVQVTGKVQLLESADPGAKVLEEADLPGEFVQAYPDYCYYKVDFVPKKAGAYAFVLSGEVNNLVLDNLKLVCKAEELNTHEYKGFNCVMERKRPLGAAPKPVPRHTVIPYKSK